MRFKTDLEAMVLAALHDGPLHGYGIVRAIRTKAEGVLRLGEGQLYPILHRLEEAGAVAGDWEFQDGKPPRRIYTLTDTGLAALEQRRIEWSAFARAVGGMLADRKRDDRAAFEPAPIAAKEAPGHA